MNKGQSKEVILEVHNLSKSYKTFPAVNNVSFKLRKGEILSFIGPNGAGKTTLLKLISGFLTSDQGTIVIDGENLTNKLDHLNSLVGTVFGGGSGFYRNSTVKDNLYFFAVLMGCEKKIIPKKICDVLDQVDLSEAQNKKIFQLSMGMLQRLHIARGLLKEKPILLLDEPTNGVDAEMSRVIRKIIKKIASNGTSIILTSHILNEVSDLADNINLFYNGQIRFSGSVDEMINESGVSHIDRPATLEESYLGFLGRIGE